MLIDRERGESNYWKEYIKVLERQTKKAASSFFSWVNSAYISEMAEEFEKLFCS